MAEMKHHISQERESDGEVRIYLIRYKIGDREFGGQLPALSWQNAAEMAASFGATVDGISVEEQPVGQICSICSGDMRIDTTQPKPLKDEWPEDIQ
jgi:hypothetical protein